MATNTIVLIVVAAMATLALAGMVVGVMYRLRSQRRQLDGDTIRDALNDEYPAEGHTASPPTPRRPQ
jgi:hypothetical protein